MAISGSSGAVRGSPKKPKDSSRTAKQAIYDNTGVGVDLRSESAKAVPSAPAAGFLKPSGVDEPVQSTKASGTAAKRLRESTEEQLEGAGKKSKKKKKSVE